MIWNCGISISYLFDVLLDTRLQTCTSQLLEIPVTERTELEWLLAGEYLVKTLQLRKMTDEEVDAMSGEEFEAFLAQPTIKMLGSDVPALETLTFDCPLKRR